MFDMNQCKLGDKLLSKHGMTLTYMFIDESQAPYRHRVKYPNGSEGTRLDNGMVGIRPLPEDHDIVGFA